MTARQLLIDRVEDAILGTGAFSPVPAAERAVDALLSFDGLLAIAEQWLGEHYPADLLVVCDPNSPDPGPRLASALRDCLEARA